jgi:hypothetical protein
VKITIESTDQIIMIDGVAMRVWNGVSERGVECFVFVHRLAVREDRDASQFEQELAEQTPPDNVIVFRQIL